MCSRFGTRPPAPALVIYQLNRVGAQQLVSSGAAAANALGLTTQMPAVQTFLSRTRSQKRYVFGKQQVTIRAAAAWNFLLANRPAGQAIRALAWLGPDQASTALPTLRSTLSPEEWRALLSVRPELPFWLAELLRESAPIPPRKSVFGLLARAYDWLESKSRLSYICSPAFLIIRKIIPTIAFIAFQVLFSLALSPSPSHSLSDDMYIFCKNNVNHPKTKITYPATMIKNSTGNIVPFIFWTQEVEGIKPLERCKSISQRIKKMLDDKTWSEAYLRNGNYNGFPAICIVSTFSDKECSQSEVIIALSKSQDSRKVLESILGNRIGLELTGNISFTFGENHPAFYVDIYRMLIHLQHIKPE